MAIIVHSWGEIQPNQKLVDLMLEKAKAFHIIQNPVFIYGHRWPNEDGTAASYDQKCWHIRDDSHTVSAGSRGLECLHAMMEGIEEGWKLRMKAEQEFREQRSKNSVRRMR